MDYARCVRAARAAVYCVYVSMDWGGGGGIISKTGCAIQKISDKMSCKTHRKHTTASATLIEV